MTDASTVDLTGKIVHAYLKVGTIYPSDGGQVALLSPRIEELSGRVCLVGKSIGDESAPPWHSEASVCLFWDSLSCYLVFDSIDSYRAALKAGYPPAGVAAPEQTPKGGLWGLFRRA